METLVVKLPSSVDLPNLRRLGEFKGEVTSVSNTVLLRLIPAAGTPADQYPIGRLVGDQTTYFTNSAGTENKGSETTVAGYCYIKSGNGGTIFIGDKYAIGELELATSGLVFDLSEFNYCSKLKKLSFDISGIATGSINNIPEIVKNLTHFEVQGANNKSVNGNLSVFEDSENLVDVVFHNTSVDGSIVNFGKCTSMTRLYVSGSVNVTGNSDDLADAMVTAGRTSGTLKYTSPLTSLVTYTFAEGAGDGRGWTKL